MRVLLVSPKPNSPDVTPGWFRIPQLTLSVLAALTPSEHKVLMTQEEFERLMRERHILYTNWSYYDHTNVCYQLKDMDPEELVEKHLDFRNKFFSYSSVIQRGYAQLRVALLIYLGVNLAYRTTTKRLKGHFCDYFNWLRQQKGVPTLDGIKAPTIRQPHALM